MFISLIMLLFSTFNTISVSKQITNIDLPSCRSCKYFKPSYLDYSSVFSRCEYFGKKDLLTNRINYEFADYCRNSEYKCGEIGKYYERDQYFEIKFFLFRLIANSPYILLISLNILCFIKFNNILIK